MKAKIKKILYGIGAAWLIIFVLIAGYDFVQGSRDISSPYKAFVGHWSDNAGADYYVSAKGMKLNNYSVDGGIIQETRPDTGGQYITKAYFVSKEDMSLRSLEYLTLNPFGNGVSHHVTFSEDFKACKINNKPYVYVDGKTSVPFFTPEFKVR